MHNNMSINSAMNESEAPLLLKRRNLSLHDHRDVRRKRHHTTCTTGTSATIATHNNCGTPAVFCTLNHGLSLNTKGMSTTLSRLQLWELDCHPQLCTYNTTTTLSMYCNRRYTGTDHRNLPLRHDRSGDDVTTKTAHLAMLNHGHVNRVKEVQATTSLHEHRDVHQQQQQPSSTLPRRVPLGAARARAVPPRAERRIRKQRPSLTRVVVHPSARAISRRRG